LKAGSEPNRELSELEKMILVHIYKYGPDSPWLLARRLMGTSGWVPKYDEDEMERACRRLEEMGLLERYTGSLKWLPTSSIKPWLKFKQRNRDVKPHGVYYQLTKEGRRLAKTLKKEYESRNAHQS
jgi:DNA-binding MarR family transcriptional regulator